MTDYFSRDKSYAKYIRISVFFAEPKSFRKMGADNIAVKASNLAAAFGKQFRDYIGDSRFSRAG
jgi:hypothetical protein